MKIIQIDIYSQIASELQKLNLSHIGNNNKQDEELFLTLKILDEITLLNIETPFTITISDKPDIRIFSKNKEIGIEVTFAINEALQKAKKIRNSINPNLTLEPILHKLNKDKKYIEKMLLKSNEILVGNGYEGDELEIETAKKIVSSIKQKMIKFMEYQKFNENFLLIYSEVLNVSPLKIISLINKELKFIVNIPFNKIVVRFQNNNYLLNV